MRLKNLLWLFVLASLWGPSFMFIKIAVQEIPPLTMVVGRVGIAALILLVILQMQGRTLPKFGSIWKHFAVMGLVHNALPFALFNWGEQYIDSALAAISNGATPLFTIILAHMLISDDRLTLSKFLGVVVGFAGLVILIGPSLLGGLEASSWGLIAVTIASLSYGVAIVYSRLNLRGLPPLVAPTAQLIMATLYMIPLALLIERPHTLPMPSLAAAGSLFVLAVFGTALAFVVYYHLIEQANASFVSMVTYVIPIFGVVLGVVVLNEQLTWNAYAGCVLILVGVMIVNGVFQSLPWRQPRQTDVPVEP